MTKQEKLDILDKVYFEIYGQHLEEWAKEYLLRRLSNVEDCKDCQDA